MTILSCTTSCVVPALFGVGKNKATVLAVTTLAKFILKYFEAIKQSAAVLLCVIFHVPLIVSHTVFFCL